MKRDMKGHRFDNLEDVNKKSKNEDGAGKQTDEFEKCFHNGNTDWTSLLNCKGSMLKELRSFCKNIKYTTFIKTFRLFLGPLRNNQCIKN